MVYSWLNRMTFTLEYSHVFVKIEATHPIRFTNQTPCLTLIKHPLSIAYTKIGGAFLTHFKHFKEVSHDDRPFKNLS